jgi:hypothetical protein
MPHFILALYLRHALSIAGLTAHQSACEPRRAPSASALLPRCPGPLDDAVAPSWALTEHRRTCHPHAVRTGDRDGCLVRRRAPSRPSLRAVPDAQDYHRVLLHFVDDDVGPDGEAPACPSPLPACRSGGRWRGCPPPAPAPPGHPAGQPQPRARRGEPKSENFADLAFDVPASRRWRRRSSAW